MGHGGHDTTGTYPPQVRTAAQFETVGGYEETSDVARILHERIVEISTAPADETVFLVAHGEKLDEDDAKWRALINAHIETLKQDPHCAQLKAIRAATVREDWPDKRDKAVKDIRDMIETASQTGRALLIADRLYGSGPYPQTVSRTRLYPQRQGPGAPRSHRVASDRHRSCRGHTHSAARHPVALSDAQRERSRR
jgi:hypothetical protein